MPRKLDYAAKAKLLRSFGYATAYGTKKKGAGSPQAKAAVTRSWEKVRLFALPGKQSAKLHYKFKFVETDTKEKRQAMEGMNPKVRTPRGFFVRVPTNARSYRISFKGGVLNVSATGQRGGKREEKIYRLDATRLAKDPEKEIRRVTGLGSGRFQEARLVVNGFDSHAFEHSENLVEFERYLAEFFAVARDPNRETHLKGRFHGKKKMSARTFADVFHVKIIRQSPSDATQTTKAKKVRRRGFRN